MMNVKRGWISPSDLIYWLREIMDLIGYASSFYLLVRVSRKTLWGLQQWKRCAISCFLLYDERYSWHLASFIGLLLVLPVATITYSVFYAHSMTQQWGLFSLLGFSTVGVIMVWLWLIWFAPLVINRVAGKRTYHVPLLSVIGYNGPLDYHCDGFHAVGQICGSCLVLVPFEKKRFIKDELGIVSGVRCSCEHIIKING